MKVIRLDSAPEGWVFDTGYVYIGRTFHHPRQLSVWGNPYKRGARCHRCGEVHITGGSTLACYGQFLIESLREDQEIREAFFGLWGKTLVCHCAPNPCHGDVMSKMLEKLADKRIEGFKESHQFLSNMYPVEIAIVTKSRSQSFGSVEAAFQSMKFLDPQLQVQFLTLDGYAAKKLARALKDSIRPDWMDIRVRVMAYCLQQKFSHPELRQALLNTGLARIVEANYWHDNFWGACTCGKCAPLTKTNMLGQLLMQIRGEIHEHSLGVYQTRTR